MPVDELVSKATADELARSIGDRATPSAALAAVPDPAPGIRPYDASLRDRRRRQCRGPDLHPGGQLRLPRRWLPGLGFLLNNEMGDFNLIPGRTDASGRIGTPANLIAPRKRMLSSMTPTIVLKEGKVRMVTGSPGGRTIPNTTLWVVLNVLEFGLAPARPWTPRGPIISGSPISCDWRVKRGRSRRVPH